MKEKDRNGKTDLSTFLRYNRGEMTDRERNAFERELQKDPFAAEAAEGLSEITAEDAGNDISKLQRGIKRKMNRRGRFVVYRIAASVAVLMIISSVFLIVQRQGNQKEPGEIPTTQAPLEISQPSAILKKESPASLETRSIPAPQAAKREEYDLRNRKVEAAQAQHEEYAAGRAAEPAKTVSIDASRIAQADEYKPSVQAVNAVAANKESRTVIVKGRVVSAEDKLPIPGASVTIKGTKSGVVTDPEGRFELTIPEEKDRTLVADFIGMKSEEFKARDDAEMEVDMKPDEMSLSEVVVVGYGAVKTDEAANIETEYTPSVPSGGRIEFDRYIENNIRLPESLREGEKAVVVISFTVTKDGETDSLKIIRSPGPDFSEEAKRLIMAGPSWNPAVSSGEKIDDNVRVRIVFKK